MLSDTFDSIGAQILYVLHGDGRVPFSRVAQVAQVIGVSDQTVAHRCSRLRSSNALRGATSPGSAVRQAAPNWSA